MEERRGRSKDPRVEEVGVSAIDGDLILGVLLAGDWVRGEVMVAIVVVCFDLIHRASRSACYGDVSWAGSVSVLHHALRGLYSAGIEERGWNEQK